MSKLLYGYMYITWNFNRLIKKIDFDSIVKNDQFL